MINLQIFRLYKIPILLVLSCIGFYAAFAYNLEREDFFKLIGLYFALGALSYKLITIQKTNFRFLAGCALAFRLIFLIALPNLSQDYCRFIWDGRLIASGWNPYQFTPLELIENPEFNIHKAKELIVGMGSLSAGHYSNYPPFNQLMFAISGWISSQSIPGAVVLLRMLIILADVGTLFMGRKLLRSLKIPEHQIFWYILNPFVIMEMTGNLHFESVMVFFIVWCLWLLHQGKWLAGAITLGLSVGVKLLPLMFLPLFYKYFKKQDYSKNLIKLLGFYLVVLITVIIGFIPFLSNGIIANYMNSVGLWFGKFEFNASIYYLVRYIGFEVKGYNIIGTAAKILPLITLLAILILSFFRKNDQIPHLVRNMLFAVTIYLLLSTTVHPWYLAVPLILSVFTKFKYVLVWTGLVFLSYYAYSNPDYNENLYLVAIEYLLVLGYLGFELGRKTKPVAV